MEATFLGYGTFYLVRNNFSVVAKDMKLGLGYDNAQIGHLLAFSAISYGVGKFLMGAVSDRSNPRIFMAFGLLCTAICNFAFGAAHNYYLHLLLWCMNGFFQGMGWPPCGRSQGHWFAERERGLTFSIWNTSHNFGGGMAGYLAAWAAFHYGGWQYAFYVPGALAAIGAVYLFSRLRDTPQSVGLPPIEEYNHWRETGSWADESQLSENVHTAAAVNAAERELSFRELFFDYVLTNKLIWLLAIGNFFSYIARYSMLDWGPMYLRETKGATLTQGGFAVLMTEFGGILPTIALGWLSDKLGGRRGMVATLCLFPIVAAFTAIMYIPAGHLTLDMAMLAVIGFCIYPVINLITIMALDLTSKKAIGTAAGFIGLFGYIGRTVQDESFGRILDHFTPLYGRGVAWQIVLGSILVCTVLAIVFLAFTWTLTPHTGARIVSAEEAAISEAEAMETTEI